MLDISKLHGSRERARLREERKRVELRRFRKKKVKRKKVKREIFKSYSEYLQSRTWRKKRRLVLLRANNMCEICHIKPAIQVHHKNYARIFHEKLTDLIALCGICHQDQHNLLTDEYIERKVQELWEKENGKIEKICL